MVNFFCNALSLVGMAFQGVLYTYALAFKTDPVSRLLMSDEAARMLDLYRIGGMGFIAGAAVCCWYQLGFLALGISLSGCAFKAWALGKFLDAWYADLTYYETLQTTMS